MEAEHTPTPWKLINVLGRSSIYGNGGHKDSLVHIWHSPSWEHQCNAARIVHCVNTFDAVVEALEGLLEEYISLAEYAHKKIADLTYQDYENDYEDEIKQARAALKTARGA